MSRSKGFGDDANLPWEPEQWVVDAVARKSQEKEKDEEWGKLCRRRENFRFDVEAYTVLLERKPKPHNWWKRISVRRAMNIFFFTMEDRGYDKPVIVPRQVEATVLHLCKNGRAYRLSRCTKECWNCGGSSPGCGLTPPSN